MNAITSVTRNKVIREEVEVLWSKEITSLEEFCKLPNGTDVAIMLNCSLTLGKVQELNGKCVNVGTGYVPIYADRFHYGNSMHEVLIVD